MPCKRDGSKLDRFMCPSRPRFSNESLRVVINRNLPGRVHLLVVTPQ
jgi:hypothetical protein